MVSVNLRDELPSVRIIARDKQTKVNNIDLQDIGLGAANALRTAIMLLTQENKNIFLIEPEQNLHPSVHINFVDLIAYSIKKNKNTYIIETQVKISS